MPSFALTLSPEIWSHVFSFCIENAPDDAEIDKKYGYVEQSTLAAALRVNTTFFLAAAPHLYRNPVVVNPASFLLGADRPLRAPWAPQPTPPGAGRKAASAQAQPLVHARSESDMLSIKGGNTKLPLLRHVRHLALVYDRPASTTESHHGTGSIRGPPFVAPHLNSRAEILAFLSGFQKETDQGIAELVRMNKIYAAACRTLYRLPTHTTSDDDGYDARPINPMPNLISVRIGKPEKQFSAEAHDDEADEALNEPDEMDIVPDLDIFAPLLAETCRPKYWCEHIPGPLLDVERPSDVLSHDNERRLPEIVSIHIGCEEEACGIVWGTTNRVYIGGVAPGRGNETDMTLMGGASNIGRNIDTDGEGSGDDDDSDRTSLSNRDLDEQVVIEDALMEEDEVIQFMADSIEDSYPSWLQYSCSTKRAIDQATIIEIYGVEKLVLSIENGALSAAGTEVWEDIDDDGDGDDGDGVDAGALSHPVPGRWSNERGAGRGDAGGSRRGEAEIEIIREDDPSSSSETDQSMTERRIKRVLAKIQRQLKVEVWERLSDLDWRDGAPSSESRSQSQRRGARSRSGRRAGRGAAGAGSGPTIVLRPTSEAPRCAACGLVE